MPARSARPIDEVDPGQARFRPSGMAELDRVLGGGLVPGAVVLLAGEPGVGKSTLLLELAARVARDALGAHPARSEGAKGVTAGGPVLYISGEESPAQVRLRAERIHAVHPGLYLAAETDLDALLAHIDAVHPSLLIVDSVQTISSQTVDGSPGGVSQVREVAAALTAVAKSQAIPAILVGHVTKDGNVAGPRVLEHMVDVVLTFEGDPHAPLRTVRATKNRYGATDEVGCFELTDIGLVELADPSVLFRTQRQHPVPGSCVTVTLEGRRPLLAEVQALVVDAPVGAARRAVSGLDAARSSMVLAVLNRRAGIPLSGQETYLATVGGVRLSEPAADLAIAVAVASARHDIAIPTDVVAFGEVGLAGDVRPVSGLERRVAEAARLGARLVLVPAAAGLDQPEPETGPLVWPVHDVAQALTMLGIPARPSRPSAGPEHVW